MCTPSGNSEFCFPSSLNVSLDFVSGTLRLSGKQNSLFPSGVYIKCILLSVYQIWYKSILETIRTYLKLAEGALVP